MFDAPKLQVISNGSERCAYLEGRQARRPLSIPHTFLTPEQCDYLLATGFRRAGYFFYENRCPGCTACQQLRVDVKRFRPSRSQRRAQKLAHQHLTTRWDRPTIDARRVEMYNQHRTGRNLAITSEEQSPHDYEWFLVRANCRVRELTQWFGEELVSVAITDVGSESLSAVYCYFNPCYSWLSLGTNSILSQIELARTQGFRWLYLGAYVAENRHLSYKANYRPHQRLIDGCWEDFERPTSRPLQHA